MQAEWSRLSRELGCAVEENMSLSAHTSFRIGGAAALAVTVPNTDTLPVLLRRLEEAGASWMTLGNGSNLLVSDCGFDGVVVRLPQGEVQVNGDTLTCPAGTPLKTLCRVARDAGLSGLEFAYGIPGTVGGALFMNAGAYGGEMADVTVEATVADRDGVRVVSVGEMDLGYRHSAFMAQRDTVIAEVTVKLVAADTADITAKMDDLIARRREKQPLEYPSAGSYFKRPTGHFAGALIEQCGLKGCRIGDAQISEKHAGFLINRGHATCAEVLALEEHVRKTVETMCGVRLEREVQLIGTVGEGFSEWNL